MKRKVGWQDRHAVVVISCSGYLRMNYACLFAFELCMQLFQDTFGRADTEFRVQVNQAIIQHLLLKVRKKDGCLRLDTLDGGSRPRVDFPIPSDDLSWLWLRMDLVFSPLSKSRQINYKNIEPFSYSIFSLQVTFPVGIHTSISWIASEKSPTELTKDDLRSGSVDDVEEEEIETRDETRLRE